METGCPPRCALFGIGRLGQRQVDRARPGEFDIGASRVEMGVAGNDLALLAHYVKENAFGGASLMGRDHVFEAGQVICDLLQTEEALAACIGFVAPHHGGPLIGRHGARTGIGKQIDKHIGRAKFEEISRPV